MIVLHKAIIYTSFGLLCEILFTGIYKTIETKGKSFQAEVSLLMVPLYMFGYIIGTEAVKIFNITSILGRVFLILFTVYYLEFTFGRIYHFFGLRPWKYDHVFKGVRLDIQNTITLAYLPFWIIFAFASIQVCNVIDHLLF